MKYELRIYFAIFLLLFLGLIPLLGIWVFLSVSLLFLTLFIWILKLQDEWITINEKGILCNKRGIQLWAYDWNSIAELRKSSRFRMPSIEVIGYDKDGTPEQFSQQEHYFQLGKTAKKAIEQFYKKT